MFMLSTTTYILLQSYISKNKYLRISALQHITSFTEKYSQHTSVCSTVSEVGDDLELSEIKHDNLT